MNTKSAAEKGRKPECAISKAESYNCEEKHHLIILTGFTHDSKYNVFNLALA